MPATELIGILLAKLTAPLADRLVGHGYTTFQEQFFDITEAQAEAEIQPHGVADDFNGKTMVLTRLGGLLAIVRARREILVKNQPFERGFIGWSAENCSADSGIYR